MKKILSTVLVAILLLSLLAGCTKSSEKTPTSDPVENETSSTSAGTEGEKQELKTIRVALIPQQLGLPFYYISKNGWDVENGFKIEYTTFQSGAPINEALGADLWDVSTIGAAGVLSLSVYDAVHIMSHEDSSAGIDFMIRADSDIAQVKGFNPEYPDVYGSPETVKGKTFMFPIGSGHHLLLGEYLHILGLEESDIKMVNMDHAAGYQAFVSGQGDLSATAYPMTDQYLKEGYVSGVNLNTADSPYYDNVIVNRKFYDKPDNQEVLVALVLQLLRCADEFKNEDILLDAMVDWYKINGQEMIREDIRDQVLTRPFLTAADYKSYDTTAPFKRMAEFFQSIDKINEQDLEKVFDNIKPEILEKALEQYTK